MKDKKDFIDKRNEILDVAEELFAGQGYEKTSVNNILDRLGIAKGTFYYYFKSKEEVLDSIIGRITEIALDRAKEVAGRSDLSPRDKLLQVFAVINVEDQARENLKVRVHEARNALTHQKALIQAITKLTPILEGIVREGINQGQLQSDYPKEYIQILLTSAIMLLDGEIFDMGQGDRRRLDQALMALAEKMFGLGTGTFPGRPGKARTQLGASNEY